MSQRKKDWDTEENAVAYDQYARKFPMYKSTSEDLVKISGIKSGMTVVDLAAGTGITTQAIIEKTGGDVSVIVVDQAKEMLKKAKERFLDNKNVRFIVAEAEDLNNVIKKPVDAIICNSAFWQMNPKKVFGAASHTLKNNGIFVFNLPDQYFSCQGFKKQPRKPLPYDFSNLVLWGKEVGLVLIAKSVKEYSKNISEIVAFNEIPVMKKNVVSKKNDKEKVINKLKKKFGKDSSKKSRWIYLVFR